MTARHATSSLAIILALLLSAAACSSREDPSGTAATARAATQTPAAGSSATAALPLVTPSATVPPAAAASPSASAASLSASAAALPSGLESPRPAPPLEGLVNADGTPFSLADHAGAPTLVFFGYTHCPDICPATIGEIFGVFQAAPETHAVFISVDPERDTAEWLASWTEYFPEGFHAVTGSPGAIRRAADGYDVRYARVETSSKGGYTMSHTANVYLIDGDGQLRRTYPFGTPAAQMAADIETLQAG